MNSTAIDFEDATVYANPLKDIHVYKISKFSQNGRFFIYFIDALLLFDFERSSKHCESLKDNKDAI